MTTDQLIQLNTLRAQRIRGYVAAYLSRRGNLYSRELCLHIRQAERSSDVGVHHVRAVLLAMERAGELTATMQPSPSGMRRKIYALAVQRQEAV